MIDNSEEMRLADIALLNEKKTSFFIENQFPAIYRENGKELIELVKSYYRFLEENDAQSVYNIRRIYEYRNIDTTLDKMLVFFKNKFLNGLFFEEDTRFIVKNILDLYRRKGSNEGIELFFKLFFNSEVEIYFPSQDMFKPSSSLWKTGSFVQMYSTNNLSLFSDIVNKKIFGDKSNAEAFVDNVYFINVKGSYVPILFISDIKGEFIRFDTIYSLDPRITYGRVYGSMRKVNITGTGTGGNSVGDLVDIFSDTGSGGKGRVSNVTENLSEEIQFTVEDGNYGYTTSNTDILVSSQNAFFSGQEGSEFIINERVKQIKNANTNIEVFGTVIGTKSDSIGILVDQPQDMTYFFEDGIEIETISREVNISRLPLFVTDKNSTASVEIGSIKNTETITIITDLLENYLDVTLNSSNYSLIPPALLEMSGTRVNSVIPNLSTQLNEAFVPETFVIGEIDTLTNINPGSDHVSDVFVLARENLLRRFNLRNQILSVSIPAGVNLLEGDTITQEKQVQTFEGDVITTEVKGQIIASTGNNITVRHLTFESFITEQPIFKQGSSIPITVNTRQRDSQSRPLGLNAIIKGDVETVTGRIQEIEIIDSGIGYEDGSVVELVNTSKENSDIDAIGIVDTKRQGITEGRWRSFVSHTNQEKVIQDSFFYQDYSYEITTDVESSGYETEYKDLMHPAGLKLFTSFGKIDVINITVDILAPRITKFRVDDNIELISEQQDTIISETGFQYLLSSIVEED
jgi:hypothetical protein